jgi:hypothetical protein
MAPLAAALGAAVIGAFLGYMFRGREFRREQRLREYGEFGSRFLELVNAGTLVQSMHHSIGGGPLPEEWDEALKAQVGSDRVRFWEGWKEATRAFEAASTRLRIVASDAVRAKAEALEQFVEDNIRSVPPFVPDGSPTDTWGSSAQTGPRQVGEDAAALARDFADVARRDVVK